MAKIAGDIRSICPPGLADSEEAWAIGATPTDEFTDRLNEWEATGSQLALNEWLDLYPKVLDGWRAASKALLRRRVTASRPP